MYRVVPFAHSVVIVCMRGNCPSLGKNLQTGSGAAAANAAGLGSCCHQPDRKPHDSYQLGRALRADLVSGVQISTR